MEHAFNWKEFAYNISSNGVALVIGNDLSMLRLEKDFISGSENYNAYLEAGEVEGDHLHINLYKYLAIKLWDIFGSVLLPSPLSINNIVLELPGKEHNIKNAIRREIRKLRDDQIVLEPFHSLARMEGFETFITVNYDNFLERAFAAQGKKVNKRLNFSIPIPAFDPDCKSDPALPSIYNLLGNVEGDYFAFTDEQCLEYIFMLQKENDCISKGLYESIRKKDIMFIGSSFPDWFMRFFIRIISREPYRTSEKIRYVACDRTLQDRELLSFLEYNATEVIPISNPPTAHQNGSRVFKNSIEFIAEIEAQFDQRKLPARNEIRYREQVFISYSRDDKSLAERLKNEFEKNGVKVFFDKDSLQMGDFYNQVIKNQIKNCDLFVALISENAIKDKDRYVYDKEWKCAIVLNNFKDQSYIRPYIIDQTMPTDTRIPEEIRELDIETILGVDDLGHAVQKFIRQNKLTPIK